MPSLHDLCERYYGTKNLYDVLKISKTADDKQIRKAYHRLSLIVHPDRVEESKKAEATEKFKVLGKVHSILSDKEKKAVYDDTGVYDEEDELVESDWQEYWQRLFKKITVEDINNYEKKYKGSEEELSDLKQAYLDGKGDLDFIYESVPFTHVDDEERLRLLLQPFIESGEIPTYKSFTNEDPKKSERRKRKWQKEAEEASRLREELNIKEENDLTALIKQRQENRASGMGNFLDNLAQKYGNNKKKAANGKGTTTRAAKLKTTGKGRKNSK